MSPVAQVLSTLLWLYLLILIARVIVDLVMMLSRDWTPRGPVLLIVEGIYTITDPPLRALRKVIPPLKLGGVALDLSFLVLFIIINVLLSLVRLLPF
ncbi:MAG: YggT family protein [Actinobacteria bacterium]|nr:YggT family protein [Actinomycetota bacterium]